MDEARTTKPGQLNVRLTSSCHLSGKAATLSREVSRSSLASSTMSLPRNFRNLEHILVAAQQQQLRQLRRLQQLKKQVELTTSQQAALEAKERAKDERLAKRKAELAQDAARKAAQAAQAEEKRRAVAAAAEQQHDEHSRKLADKLARTKPRFDVAALEMERRANALKAAARIEHTQQRKEQVLEERRLAVQAAEEAAERRMQQKQELKLLQDAIRREEEFLAEQRRAEIQARAEADEAAKMAYYQAKQEEREQRLEQRQSEAEILRSLRAAEAQARFDYIRSRAGEVNAQEEARRHELAKKLEEKLQRAEALSEERQALTVHMRDKLLSNELKFKQVVERARTRGNHELPAELLEMMDHLEEVVSAAFVPAGAGYALDTSTSVSTAHASPLSRAASSKASPPRQPASTPAAAANSGSVGQLHRQQEATLQCVLEEEIMREMERESMLQSVADPAQHKRLLKQFAAEREAAKARIQEIGSQLLDQQ